MKDEFKLECDEWLNPLGYTLWSKSMGMGTVLTYLNMENPQLPAVDCHFSASLGKSVSLRDDGAGKLFISLRCGDLQFKHPDFHRYLKAFKHYHNLMEMYPPNLDE